MPSSNGSRRAAWRSLSAALALAAGLVAPAAAQTPDAQIQRVPLTVGRSYPIETPTTIARISVANPEVADVAVVGDRDVVINAKTAGETDVLIWATGVPRQHLRIVVQSSAERQQVVLAVKFAEVRRDLLQQLGFSGLYSYTDGAGHNTTIGTGNVSANASGGGVLSTAGQFLGVLSDFGTDDFLGAIDAEATRGNARILAEPQIIAANRETASFLAGGEIPIPVVQGNQQAGGGISVQFREFGIRLSFTPEILNDSLVKLHVAPEVSSLDFGNAVLLNGFRIPALRTRRIESTVDVKRNTSLVISGLFNEEREVARTGIPFLMDIPILGNLFSSTRWQNSESELLVIVTPYIVDPNRPRAQDVVPLRPRTELPAREAIEPRLQPPGAAATPAPTTRPPATRPPR